MRSDLASMVGKVDVFLFGPDGALRLHQRFRNLVTDAGDGYYVAKAVTGIAPASASAPSPVTGMKLGTGSTAAAKSGAGAGLVTYLSGSAKTFDTTYPKVVDLGSGLGVSAVYRCTWAPGEATSANINELVIVNDAATNATSTAANTISRSVTTSALDKGAEDTLVVAWQHTFLGS
jgi:hypothetical protein